MARHFTVYTEDLSLRELKRRLEKHAKFQLIAHKDCKRLSELLVHQGIHISPMTLARCFGITYSSHRPFLATLDLLSIYLGYNSFSHFSSDLKETTRFSLSRPKMQFSTGEYSYSALELALQVNDWETAMNLIESFDAQHSSQLDFIWFLGEQVRHHENKNDFLDLLARTENGKKYFYEWFVDEDDSGHYFSTALKEFYKPQAKSVGDRLFVQAFLDAKNIYKGFKREIIFPEVYLESVFNLNDLHYHQVSRLFEIRILIEYQGLNRFSEMEKIVDELLSLIANRCWRDQNWMLMRAVKALIFTGHFNALLHNHASLKKLLVQLFQCCEGTMLSSADLALQFVIHATPEFKEVIQLSPTRLRHPIYNEQKARIAIECATAILYSEPALHSTMVRNLNRFTADNDHSWVLNLLKNKNLA